MVCLYMPCWISGRAIQMPTHCPLKLSPTNPAGPGACFALEENDVVDRLTALEDITDGKLRWSEAAGLKQVVRSIDIDEEIKLLYLFPITTVHP